MGNIIELAKSGRASCRICKQKIEKNIPRLGVEREFTRDGNTYTSFLWHHMDCAYEKLHTEIVTAEIMPDIPNEVKEKIKEMKTKAKRSGFTVKGISEINRPDIIVNVKAKVLRAMQPKLMENYDKQMEEGVSVYVEDNNVRSKILIWGENTSLELKKDDIIYILSGLSEFASNDQIQIHVTKDSKILINPTNDQIENVSAKTEIYQAKGWKRPSGMNVEFEYAKTARASCFICGNKINKGELKLVKPEWMENEKTKQQYPGNKSFHINCTVTDENATEILLEAFSRLTPDLLENEHDQFRKLTKIMPNCEAKKLMINLLKV